MKTEMQQVGLGLAVLVVAIQGYGADWQTVWNDEFDSASIDRSKWSFIVNGDGGGNNEEQYYTDRSENTYIENGALVINARRESYTGDDGASRSWTSGRLQSKFQGDWTYGKIEARIQVPVGSGIWPAFWMLPSQLQPDAQLWAYTGEIDILEAINLEHKIYGTLHYGASWPENKHSGNFVQLDDITAWHTYTLEWKKDECKWSVDGTPYQTLTPADLAADWPFNGRAFHLLLNVAVGGQWPNAAATGDSWTSSVDALAPTPDNNYMRVDYVRVYKDVSDGDADIPEGDNHVYRGDTSKVYSMAYTNASDYVWSVPNGWTITSGQGTASIKVNIGSSAQSGTVACSVDGVKGEKSVAVELAETMWLNDFDSATNCTVSGSGTTINTQFPNPAPGGINTSSTVLKYIRQPMAWDNFQLKNMGAFDVGLLKSMKAKLLFDVYTTENLAGEPINIVIENEAVVAAVPSWDGNTGRLFTLSGMFGLPGVWHTVEVGFSALTDGGVLDNFKADMISVLVNPGRNSSETLYFDNFRICFPNNGYTLENMLMNYDGVAAVSPDTPQISGGYSVVTNPDATGANNSPNCLRYERSSGSLYDTLVFNGVSQIANLYDFKNGNYVVKLDVFTVEPAGKIINLNFENEQKADNNGYPSGRGAVFQTKTTKSNEWETLEFHFHGIPDWETASDSIDQLILMISSGTAEAGTYYFDNLRIEKYNQEAPLVEVPRITEVEVVDGNLVFNWGSQTNCRYSVLSSTNLLDGFSAEQTNLEAYPPQNSYTGPVSGVQQKFWRISID